MRARDVIGIAALAAIAAGSWYLAASLRQPEVEEDTGNTFTGGFYLKTARILGMGDEGNLLYEILADYAVQQGSETEFRNVSIRYAPVTSVAWTVTADTAVVTQDQELVRLRGHVRAVSPKAVSGELTKIETAYLELQPERFQAETDERVQIHVGAHSLTATGMLALLRENRLHLKSNVNGRFVP